jgi:hypothetical protein
MVFEMVKKWPRGALLKAKKQTNLRKQPEVKMHSQINYSQGKLT